MEIQNENTSNIASKNNITVKTQRGAYQMIEAPNDKELYDSFKNILLNKANVSNDIKISSPEDYLNGGQSTFYNKLINLYRSGKVIPEMGQTGWIRSNNDLNYQIKEEVADVHQTEIGWQKITNKELGYRPTAQYFNEETFVNNLGQKLKATKVFEWSPLGYKFVTPTNIEPGKTYYMNFTTDPTTNKFITPEHFTKLDIKPINNGIQLNFLTKDGYRYYIESSSDLINWTTLQTPMVVGENKETTYQLFGKDSQNSYYRLRIANFNLKQENFGLNGQVEKLTINNISDKNIQKVANDWLVKNNITNFIFSDTDLGTIKTSLDNPDNTNKVIQETFLNSLSKNLGTNNNNICKTLLNTNTPIPEIIKNKNYSLTSNTNAQGLITKEISNIREQKVDIPLNEYVMLKSYQMPNKQEENVNKFINYASLYEKTDAKDLRIMNIFLFRNYTFTPLLTINEFGKGISNISSSYSSIVNNGIAPAKLIYEELPYFAINIKHENTEIINSAFVKRTDGYYLYPANQKVGTKEYSDTITQVILPQLSTIYKTNKDSTVLKTMLILEESITSPNVLEKLTNTKQLNSVSKIEFNENLTESHLKNLLNANPNRVLSIENEPASTYLTNSFGKLFDKALNINQAKELFSVLQEMYSDAIPMNERGYLGNKSFLMIQKLNEYMDKGMLNKLTYSEEMAKNIEQLPEQMGTLASKTSVTMKDIITSGKKEKLATVNYKVGNKTITYNVYLDESGKMKKIVSSTDIAESSTGKYVGNTGTQEFTVNTADIQYVISRIKHALVGSNDPVLQELFKYNEGSLEINNAKAVDLINNTGNIRSADSEVFFVCKTNSLSTTTPEVTIIEDAKGCSPVAIKAILKKDDIGINTNDGQIFLHKSKSVGSSSWEKLSWNSVGQSNLNIGNDGNTVRIQSGWFEDFFKGLFANWVLNIVGGWMISLAKEALQGIDFAKQAMQTLEWANSVQETATSFMTPFSNAKTLVDTIKNPQKLLSAYIPVEVKNIESEINNNLLAVRQVIAPLERNAETLEKTKKEIENNYMPIIMVGNKVIQDTKKELVSVQAEIDNTTQSISTKAIADLDKIKGKYEQQFGETLTSLKEIKFELAAPLSYKDGKPIYSEITNISNSIKLPEILKEESISQSNITTENLTTIASIDNEREETSIETNDIKVSFNKGLPAITEKAKGITVNDSLVENGTISFEEYAGYVGPYLENLNNELEKTILPNNTSVVSKTSNNKIELTVSDATSGTIYVSYDKTSNKLQYSPNTPSFFGNTAKLKEMVQIAKDVISTNVLKEIITKSLKSFEIAASLKKNIVHDSPRLTDDEMTKTLANMSDWIYKPDTGEKTAEMQEWLKSGFKPVYDKTGGHSRLICNDTKTGYYGEFLVNDSTKTVVMVNRGTDVDNGIIDHKDRIEDFTKLTLGLENQVASAKNFYEQLKSSYPEYSAYQVMHTGHSLGGSIAQAVCLWNREFNKRKDIAVSFCAPGILPFAMKWGVYDKDKNYDYLNGYNNSGDEISMYIPTVSHTFYEKYNHHSLDNFKNGLQRYSLNTFDIEKISFFSWLNANLFGKYYL